MGSAIAAHFSNIGCNVTLLDIVDKNQKNKNYVADQAIKKLLKIKPSPLTLNSNIKLIKSGNIEDDLEKINNSEWVIEAVVENINIKRELYKKIDNIMKNELIDIVKNVKKGNSINNFLTASWFLNAVCFMKIKKVNAKRPEKSGEITHDNTISPILVRFIALIPLNAKANPQIAPIVE